MAQLLTRDWVPQADVKTFAGGKKASIRRKRRTVEGPICEITKFLSVRVPLSQARSASTLADGHIARADHALAIGSKRQCGTIELALQISQFLPRSRIPELDGLAIAANQQLAIGGEGNCLKILTVPFQAVQQLSGNGVPEEDGMSHAGCQPTTVRRPGQRVCP